MRRIGLLRTRGIADMAAAASCLILVAAMVSPTLQLSREKIHRAKCVANLKRLWRAFSAYVQEHDGVLPAAGRCDRNMPEDWTWGGNIVAVPQTLDTVERIEIEKGAMWPYVYGSFRPGSTEWYGDARKNLYLCPTAGPVGRKRGLSYSMNFDLDAIYAWPAPGVILANVPSPEKIFLLVEESQFTVNDGCFMRLDHESETAQSEVHEGGANHLFCDGHVERLLRAELEEKMESGEGFKWQNQ